MDKQQLEALEKECAALRQERDNRAALAAANGSDLSYAKELCNSWRRTTETLEQEKVDAREEARKWRDRYSSLFVRVACGVPSDITTAGIFLSWQREIDAAYEVKK